MIVLSNNTTSVVKGVSYVSEEQGEAPEPETGLTLTELAEGRLNSQCNQVRRAEFYYIASDRRAWKEMLIPVLFSAHYIGFKDDMATTVDVQQLVNAFENGLGLDVAAAIIWLIEEGLLRKQPSGKLQLISIGEAIRGRELGSIGAGGDISADRGRNAINFAQALRKAGIKERHYLKIMVLAETTDEIVKSLQRKRGENRMLFAAATEREVFGHVQVLMRNFLFTEAHYLLRSFSSVLGCSSSVVNDVAVVSKICSLAERNFGAPLFELCVGKSLEFYGQCLNAVPKVFGLGILPERFLREESAKASWLE